MPDSLASILILFAHMCACIRMLFICSQCSTALICSPNKIRLVPQYNFITPFKLTVLYRSTNHYVDSMLNSFRGTSLAIPNQNTEYYRKKNVLVLANVSFVYDVLGNKY